MPLKPSEIAVGKCYVTSTDQARKVTEITDGNVLYLARSHKLKNEWHPGSTKANPPSLETFAAAVDSEIPCED